MSLDENEVAPMHKMRRSAQQLSPEETAAIFETGTSGVLALIDADGLPYAVPLSYVYIDSPFAGASTEDSEVIGEAASANARSHPVIYFHCALSGHKLEALAAHDRVSFCVIAADDVIAAQYTTAYRSAIAFGRAHVVDDADEKLSAVRALGQKYNPTGTEEELSNEIAHGLARMHMIRLGIDRMTGKEGIELTRARKRSARD